MAMGAGTAVSNLLGGIINARTAERTAKRQMAENRRDRELKRQLAARSEAQNAITRQISNFGNVGQAQGGALDRLANVFRQSML